MWLSIPQTVRIEEKENWVRMFFQQNIPLTVLGKYGKKVILKIYYVEIFRLPLKS